jgi:hypothetical protein
MGNSVSFWTHVSVFFLGMCLAFILATIAMSLHWFGL